MKNIYALFFIFGLVFPAYAAHKMPNKAEQESCSDPQQPATLNCAPAPSAQFDHNGRLWIVWSYGGHVYVSSSDDLGNTLNASVVVNRVPEPISDRGENRPKIIIDKTGKIYISWTTPLAERYTGNVRFSYSDDNGQHFSEPITVNDNLDITGHRFEAMAVNEQGIIFMAWLDKRDRYKASQQGKQYHGAALYYSYSDNGGKHFVKNIKLMAHTCECCRVAIDIDTDQMPVIMWRNIYAANTRDHSLVKFVTQDKPGKVIRVSNDNWKIDACPHHGPALSISHPENATQSDYHLVWFNNAPDKHGLFYRRIDKSNLSDSHKLPAAITIGNYKQRASHADIYAQGKQVWIVWKEFDGKSDLLKIKYSADRGKTWSEDKPIASTSEGADYPFILAHQENIYIQWQTKKDGFKLYPVNQDE